MQAILNLPKGTELFMSDLHGEYEAFIHIINNGSGIIKSKIEDIYETNLTEAERKQLATLIYYPEEKLNLVKKGNENLKEWYNEGLTTITISVVSHIPEVNKKVYMPQNKSYIDLPDLIKYLHGFGFSLRLTCVCCKDMMDTPEKVDEFIKFAKQNKVEQVTLRPVNDEFRRQSATDWIKENRLTDNEKEKIKEYLENNGTKLLELERIGTIYDVNGQNVCISLPLNKNTRDTSPENARNLIFFQDGHIRYEWEMEGGILL